MNGKRTLIGGNRFIRDAFAVLTDDEVIAMATVEDSGFSIRPWILSKMIWALLSDEDRIDFPHYLDVLRWIERRPFQETLLRFALAVSRLEPYDNPGSRKAPAIHFNFN